MREVLFRGKWTDNGEWIEGFYSAEEYNPYIDKIEYIPRIQIIGKCVSLGVIPETVGQFTGLTDKNGKRIFEGDILTLENEGIYAAVKYNESKAAFYVEDEDHEDYLGESWETNVIIIGNIHDNSDILKGGGDNG